MKRRRGIEAKIAELVGDNNEDFSIKRKKALLNLTLMILDTVRAIGKERNYTLIFRNEENFVLYTANQFDLTREVITRVDAQASKR